MSRSLRVDAQDNRDRLLESARELFGRRGLEVPMRDVARRAGVATATLYRRFPTKQDLVLEAFGHELRACCAIVSEAATDPDPWRGFTEVIERVLVLNVRNHRFTHAFFAAFPGAFDLGAHRDELLGDIATIARRAMADGRLRADFELSDFTLVVLAGRGLASGPHEDRVVAARRFARIAIAGFRSTD